MVRYDQHFLKILALIIVILATVANFHFLSTTSLHPDEAYYWVWSRHLEPGYFDNSPLIAYIIRIFTSIGGSNEIWLRLPALLGWIFSLIFVYFFTGKICPGKTSPALAVILSVFVPLVMTGSHLMTPDILMIVSFLFTWYYLYLAVEKSEKTAWYKVGIFAGIALLAKFQATLIAIMIVAMLLIRPSKRRMLLQKEPYLAALIALFIFAPVFYWNWQNQWAAFLFQSQHGIQKGIDLENLLTYFSGQLGVFSPLLFLTLIYYTIKKLIRPKQISSLDAFLLSSFIPVFLFFGFTSLTYPAAANWPAIGYLPAIIFLAKELTDSFCRFNKVWRFSLIGYLIIAGIMSVCLISFVRYPQFYISSLGFKLQPSLVLTNSAYGWKELARKVDRELNRLYPAQDLVPIFCDGSYQTASELAFYLGNRATVLTTRQTRRSQFDYITTAIIDQFEGRGGLLVLQDEAPSNTNWYFNDVKFIKTISIRRFGAELRSYYVYAFQSLNVKALKEMAVNKPLGYPGRYQD